MNTKKPVKTKKKKKKKKSNMEMFGRKTKLMNKKGN